MLEEVFLKKANQMGDFYIYFRKATGPLAYGVCTHEITEDFMKLRTKHIKVKQGEVLLWNWRYHSPLIIPYESIKKMTPLSAVLKNNVL